MSQDFSAATADFAFGFHFHDNAPGLYGSPSLTALSWEETQPAQQPMGTNVAAQQPENMWRGQTQPTPAGSIPGRQQEMTGPGRNVAGPHMAAPQPENIRGSIPDKAPGFFGAAMAPGAMQAMASGPAARIEPVNPQWAAEMRAAGRQLGERKKLGPRGQKRKAEEPVDTGRPKSARKGMEKAKDGQPSLRQAWAGHRRSCEEQQGCVETCLLKSTWPDVWEENTLPVSVVRDDDGEKVWTTGLFSHMYANRDGYKGRGRPAPTRPEA